MRTLFVLLLTVNWVINPIAIFIAHILKVDANPTLVQILLVTAFNAPFGLVFNEVLAACDSKKPIRKTLNCFRMLILLQFIYSSVLINVLILERSPFAFGGLLVSLLLVIGSGYSYKSVVLIYRFILSEKISKKFLVLVHALPGFATMALYCIYFAIYPVSHAYADITLYSILFVPAASQYLFLITRYKKNRTPTVGVNTTVSVEVFLLLVAEVFIFSAAGLVARKTIALSTNEFAALAIVAVNGCLSLFSAVAKADFFLDKDRPVSTKATFAFGILAAVIYTYIFLSQNVVVAFIGLIIVQYALVHLLIWSRQNLDKESAKSGESNVAGMGEKNSSG